MNRYKITTKLSIPCIANRRYEGLSSREADRGYRTIGGDKGDIRFYGFIVDDETGSTMLDTPELHTGLELTPAEADDIASEVLAYSFDAIGVECVY